MWQKQIFTNFQLLLPLPFVVMFPDSLPTSSLGQAPALQTHCPDLGEQPEFFRPLIQNFWAFFPRVEHE